MPILTTPAPTPTANNLRERSVRTALRWIAALAALTLTANLAILLWARHDLTPVESLVVLHSNMFAHGEGLYWGLNRYPYTISAYGPIFYAVAGYLHAWGLPAYQSARLLSFTALIGALWLCWRSLAYLATNRYAPAAALILAASLSNALYWGTTGQVDMLGCFFSLAAFTAFLKFREQRDLRALALAGVLVILAVFTKQTFIAAGMAIGLTLLREDRRLAAIWIPSVALTAGGIAFGLNAATHGGFFEDAVLANINPFAWYKLEQHLQYLILTGAGVITTAAIGAWHVSRRTAPLYLYAALAAGVWLVTAPKVGSDLNYQVETMLVLSICAGSALDQLDFFPSVLEGRRTWVTLLQLPLMLYLTVNLLLSARVVTERATTEFFKREETAALKPFVERPGRLLSPMYDSLVHYRGRIEVEPLIYSMLVKAGMTDETPLLRDLEQRRIETVILDQDLFGPASGPTDPEIGTLPQAQLTSIRNNYQLLRHLEGPISLYIYEPRRN